MILLVGGCSSKKNTAPEPPATPSILYERMESFYKNKDYAQSKILFDELVAKFPDSQESAKAKTFMVNIDELVQNEAAIKKEIDDKANNMNEFARKMELERAKQPPTPYTPPPKEKQTVQRGPATQRINGDSFVAISEDALEILSRYCVNKNQAGVMRMMQRGEVFSIADGTRVTVISRGIMVHRIEVEEGPMVGKRGYVPAECVR